MKTPDPLYWQKLRQKSLAKNPLKRSPLISKPVKLKPISEKRKKELREYEKVKAKFFETIQVCQYPNCQETNLDLHHKIGRCGKNLIDINNFAGLCRKHHIEIEENPLMAYRLGLSGSRLNNN